MKGEHTKRSKKLIFTGVFGIFLIILVMFLADYLPLKNNINTGSVEDKYGIALNLPDGWFIEDCSSESKRYIKDYKYVCRWSSESSPSSGARTVAYLFVSDNKNIELTSEDLITFAKERQEYGWAGEMANNPNISVSFDKTIEPVLYGSWNGVQLDDYIEDKESKGWYLWTSSFFPIKTPRANIILEINHIDKDVFTEEVIYTAEDILKRIKLL